MMQAMRRESDTWVREHDWRAKESNLHAKDLMNVIKDHYKLDGATFELFLELWVKTTPVEAETGFQVWNSSIDDILASPIFSVVLGVDEASAKADQDLDEKAESPRSQGLAARLEREEAALANQDEEVEAAAS